MSKLTGTKSDFNVPDIALVAEWQDTFASGSLERARGHVTAAIARTCQRPGK